MFLLFTLSLPFICRFIALLLKFVIYLYALAQFLTHFKPFWCLNLRNAFLQCLLRNPLNSADCHLSVWLIAPWIWLIATFQSGWLPPFSLADCHLSMRLIATFQCGWLPFFDPADATLCLIWPECHIKLAWVPIYSFGLGAIAFNPAERHITLAWVPIYSFGLGDVVLIRLMPRPLFESSLGAVVTYSAWVPFLFKVGHSSPASAPFYPKFGKLAIHFRQVCHFIQVRQVRRTSFCSCQLMHHRHSTEFTRP